MARAVVDLDLPIKAEEIVVAAKIVIVPRIEMDVDVIDLENVLLKEKTEDGKKSQRRNSDIGISLQLDMNT